MDINKLYEELGRADAAAAASKRAYDKLHDQHREARRALDRAQSEINRAFSEKHDTLVKRLKVMRDAVTMAEGGMDPLMAKLKATGENQEDCHDLWNMDDDCCEDVCEGEDDESLLL